MKHKRTGVLVPGNVQRKLCWCSLRGIKYGQKWQISNVVNQVVIFWQFLIPIEGHTKLVFKSIMLIYVHKLLDFWTHLQMSNMVSAQ